MESARIARRRRRGSVEDIGEIRTARSACTRSPSFLTRPWIEDRVREEVVRSAQAVYLISRIRRVGRRWFSPCFELVSSAPSLEML